jgi:WD40-like Beta Propeller Repeat
MEVDTRSHMGGCSTASGGGYPLPGAGKGVPVRAVLLRIVLAVTVAAALAAGGIAYAGASVVPGRNGKIVVGQVFPNFGFTINPSGSERHTVGPPGSTTCVGWSPNGRKVLCNLWGRRHVQPAIANPDGSGFHLLNPARKLDLFCISWSPTGRRLLCHSEGMRNRAQAGLYSIRAADGRNLVRITATPRRFSDIGYGFSPNGSRVLYRRHDDARDRGVLFSVRSNGTGTIRLSPQRLLVIDLDFFDRIGADWSPDGSRVAFAAFIPSINKTALFVVNADGTGLHRVTPLSVGAISAQWSPRGNFVTFESCCAKLQVFVVNVNGRHLRQLTFGENSLSETPVWSPNGQRILFQRSFLQGNNFTGGALYTVGRNGASLFRVTKLPTFVFAHGGAFFYSWGTARP